MLDTIWCSFPVVIPWHKLKGWSKKTSLNTYKNYYYKQNNGIQFKYYYNQYNSIVTEQSKNISTRTSSKRMPTS